MKTNLIFGYILILLLFITSCNKSNNKEILNNHIKKIIINKAKKCDDVKLSDLIDTIFTFKLSQFDNYPIGVIDKAIFTEKYIIIYDKKANSIFVYDYLGKCLSRIMKRGKGKGEYFQIKDFDFDEKNGLIIIKDNFIKKIIKYDLKGNLVATIQNKHYAHDFCMLNGNIIACFNTRNPLLKNECYQLFFTTINGEIKKRFLPFEKDFLKDNHVLPNYAYSG